MPQSRVAWFRDILKQYPRVGIVGAPKTGKSVLTRWANDRTKFHSDDYKHLDWSVASQELADDVNRFDRPLVVEGVAVARAVRKGMKLDALIVLTQPLAEQSPKHVAMGKGIMTVLAEVKQQQPDLPVLYAPPIAKDDDAEEEETEA